MALLNWLGRLRGRYWNARQALFKSLEQRSLRFQIVRARLRDAQREMRGLFGDLRVLPPGLPRCRYEAGGPRSMTLHFPLDHPTLNLARDIFRYHGWEVGDFKLVWGAYYRAEALGRGRVVFIQGSERDEGATCKIEKIGTVQREEGVYEVRCNEEAVAA